MFDGCESLKTISFPRSLIDFKTNGYLFQNCNSLRRLTFHSGISALPQRTCNQCAGIHEIIVPNGISSLGSSAFTDCFASVYEFPGHTSVPTVGSNVITMSRSSSSGISNPMYGTLEGLIIKVPTSLVNTWKTESGWTDYAGYIVGF